MTFAKSIKKKLAAGKTERDKKGCTANLFSAIQDGLL